MIAVTGGRGGRERAAGGVGRRWSPRARTATRRPRLRSPVAAGVKRKSLLMLVPRRARAAARRGSETAGVKAPTGRPPSAAAGRFAFVLGELAARAGASSSAIASSDAPPAVPMARKLPQDFRLPSSSDLIRVAAPFLAKRARPRPESSLHVASFTQTTLTADEAAATKRPRRARNTLAGRGAYL